MPCGRAARLVAMTVTLALTVPVGGAVVGRVALVVVVGLVYLLQVRVPCLLLGSGRHVHLVVSVLPHHHRRT